MLTEFRQIEDFPSYEISEDGIIRNILTHDLKRIVKDAKGRPLVTLYTESGPEKGYGNCIYISDLLHDIWGRPLDEDLHDTSHNELMQQIERARKASEVQKVTTPNSTVTSSRKRTTITCEETGQTFNGYTAAAKAFGFNYDKFYNTFYETKMNTITFEGKTFHKS